MGAPPDSDEHYFSEAPSSRSRPRSVSLHARGHVASLTTDRGTFSPDRIDPGTTFLIERAPAPPTSGRFLDLGCGYGPIAITLALESPDAEVVGVDVNERSRALTAANAESLGLGNVVVRAPEDATGDFDLIWSNPPIRIGKPALHDLLLRWLGRLTPTGTAVLVVNRHLGADSLQRWLTDRGHATERLASRKGYRLLSVSAARRVDDETQRSSGQ